MKKVLWIFCAAALALVACNKNNTENTSEDAGKLSDLEYFQDRLVTLDQNGNIRGYNVGQNLNEADPSEITVPVDTYDEARELFLRWLPSGSKPSVSGKTYTWEMTDQENKSEGKVIFAESTAPGTIATISINASGAKARSVKFIPFSAWPENASGVEDYLAVNYYVGATIQVNENKGAGTGEYVVIKEWTPQEPGLMIQIDPNRNENNQYQSLNNSDASSISTTQRVREVLHDGNNYTYFVDVYGKSKNWPSLDNRYITSKVKTVWAFGSDKYYCVNLENGKETTITKRDGKDHYRVFIYWFTAAGDQVVIW